MKGLALLLLFAGAVAAGVYFLVLDQETAASGSARIVSVDARFSASTTVVVDVEVEATAPMPPVGPHVIVRATCDDVTDEATGDIGLMNNAPTAEVRSETVELFTGATFATQPLRCRITVRTSDGASRAHACIELGTPRAGEC
jgi:hypothetical protein